MRSTVTVALPEDVRAELDRYTREAGVTRGDVVREPLRDYLFVRRFRRLRARLLETTNPQGALTDDDVFDAVS